MYVDLYISETEMGGDEEYYMNRREEEVTYICGVN